MLLNKSKKRGIDGEIIAIEYLKSKGFLIIKHNFYSRYGEIDIIATQNMIEIEGQEKQEVTVFVEVKNYQDSNWLHPLEIITKSKQKKLIKTAKYYILSHSSSFSTYRFDAIIIRNNNVTQHLENIMTV